ncbi:hypothetical protein [Niallia taxi]|uniref:hypothetical protein n=1 Tax=Niallia taxi TaxID=2499688 RepID=UPI0013E3A0C3|nr:hypothetical protein [Niallia taxi]
MNDALGIAWNIYNGQVAAGFVDVLDNRTAYKSSFITYKVCVWKIKVPRRR